MKKEIKNLYILHGYDAAPTDHWYPWLKSLMQKDEIITQTMSFPNSSSPEVKNWLDYLEKKIPVMDKNTFIVAHSLGCITLLRYLQERAHPARLGGYILVAGFYGLMPNIRRIPAFANLDMQTENALAEFSDFIPDYDYLSGVTKNKVVIAAQDDRILPFKLNMSRNLAESLNAEFYAIRKGGHFLADDGFSEFPLVYNLLNHMIIGH